MKKCRFWIKFRLTIIRNYDSYENKIMLASTIKRLPPDLREIIELSYYEDLNQREISEKMNMSQMQVSRRLKKALSRMYEMIKNNGE